MPRPNLIRSNIHPYHITARCNNKEFFPIPMEEMWEICLKHLKYLHKDHEIKVHAFVLMGNHFHLLCQTPRANIDQAMMVFMKKISDDVHLKNNTMNHLWGSRYKWSLIQSQAYYYQVYKYIYQNPLRAKITSLVQDYPFSTLNEDLPFPIYSHISMAFGGRKGELHWLNDVLKEHHSTGIKRGLKKGNFKLAKKVISTF